MFPLLLQGLCEQVCARGGRGFRPSRAVLVTCVLLTAVCFSAIKVSDVAAEGWRWGLGFLQWPARGLWALLADTRVPPVTRVVHTVDATDLFTLPALLVSLAVGWRRLPSVPRAGEGGTQAAHRDPHLRLAAPGP
jgi:hypothetical protein